jgi:hypothetical protein
MCTRGFVHDLQDEFWIGWSDSLTPYTFANQNYRQYSAIADLHTLQFTVTHALGFSVFTSHNLATDFLQSHCHFKSQMKSSSHSFIPFLPLFCNCQFWRFDSIQCSAPKLISWQAGVSKLHSTLLDYYFSTEVFFIITLQGPRRKHSLSIVGKVCLQPRCIATEVTRLLLVFPLPRECVYRVVT